MKSAITTVIALIMLPAVAIAGDMTDPLEILKKVDEAAKAVKSARYEVAFQGLGAAEAQLGKLTAKVVTQGWTGQGPEKFWWEGTHTRGGSAESRKLTAGGDGENYYLIDHNDKKAYEDIDPQVLGSAARIVLGSMVLEFVHPAPFSDEINGQNRELKGSANIEGEDCYEIEVTYAGGQKALWCFSKKDFLPRRRIDIFNQQGQEFRQQKTVTKLETDPKVKDSMFALKLPDGYEKIDDFAP